MDEIREADLGTRALLRRLALGLSREHSLGGPLDHDLARDLEDTAYSVLLGLHPEAAPLYVPPEEREAGVAAGLAAAADQLQQDGFPSLSRDLGAAPAKLKSSASCQLLGSITEAQTGAALAMPLTEHSALLAMLLSLQGSRPSVRQQRFTFQAEQAQALPAAAAARLVLPALDGAAPTSGSRQALGRGALGHAAAAGPTLLHQQEPHEQQHEQEQQQEPFKLAAPPAPLTTAVFEAAPDPHALTDGSSAVAVLLPSELGLPVGALAGSEEVQDLVSGLASRPLWDPAGAAALPPLRSSAWLPLPASLAELRGDSRRGARPAPLGLPLSLLGMADEPGSGTLFSPDAAGYIDGHASDGEGSAASADSVQPVPAEGSGGGGQLGPAAGGSAAAQQLGLSVQLWSLEEAELARHALLALQGVAASLRRLQALLAAPEALPRRGIAGLLAGIVAAGELRQRLQQFVAAHTTAAGSATAGTAAAGKAASAPATPRQQRSSRGSGDGASSSSSSSRLDPTKHAFAVGVAEVLQRQSATLQAIEQQHAVPWLQSVAAGGSVCGQRLHRMAPTLLQVALRTRGVQAQLQRLAEVCRCSDSARPGTPDGMEVDEQAGGGGGASGWPPGSFPSGTELLTYLYRCANEAEAGDAPMLRGLFAHAVQPYLRHMHGWAFSKHPVSAEFGTAGNKELLTLDFLPTDGRRGPGPLVPVDPPAFLQSVHAAFMRAGSQLRLLHSLEPQGRQLARQLADLAEQEMAQRQASASAGGQGAQLDWLPAAGAHAVLTFSAQAPAAAEAVGGGLASAASGGWERWLPLPGAPDLPAASSDGSQDLQLSTSRLQQVVEISEGADSARSGAVDGWLDQMALQRRLAEHAAAAEQLGRAAAQRERQAQLASMRSAALSRQQSAKAALLQEQRAAVREQRARAALQAEREGAADRQEQLLAAQREHAAAVAELERALGRSGLSDVGRQGDAAAQAAVQGEAEGQPTAPPSAATTAAEAGGQAAAEAPGMGAARGHEQPPAGAAAAACVPALKLGRRPAGMQQQAGRGRQQENAGGEASARGLPAGAGGGTARPPLQLGRVASQQALALGPPGTISRQPSGLPEGLPALVRGGSMGWGLPAGTTPGQRTEAGLGAEQEEADQSLAPLPAVLECCVTQSILSQYRAVSRACVRLFLDELKVLEHLEALRRFFFQGAGDWADALVAALGAHADSLLPVAEHRLAATLAEAARGTSVEDDPYASLLGVRLLPASSSAVTAQAGAISAGTPMRRARSFWNSQLTVTLAPTQLDALDCVCLEYRVGWPLSAVITEDTLQGYAAVFSLMLQLRRVEQQLRGLHSRLAAQPKSSADLLLSEEAEDVAHRRIQRLRAFHFGATQFVSSVQAFLHARTAGDGWVQLMAKLMVSSEEVAATLISRQPSATMTGLLSRMNSLGPTGKAAHQMAQQMTRALSASQPGSPRPAAAGSTGQLARFNSLMAAARSAASSAATSPRGGAPLTARQRSRFADGVGGGGSGPGPKQQAGQGSMTGRAGAGAGAGGGRGLPGGRSRQAGEESGACSPTGAATAGNAELSRLTSLGSVLLAQAAAEAGSGGGAEGPDAAAWAQAFSQSQQGISDLQELLDLHRRYVLQASADCLTFGGSPAAQSAVAGALQCLLDFCFRLRAAVRSGAGGRAEESWAQALHSDDVWEPLASCTADFEERVQQLQELVRAAGTSSALCQLEFDFNGFYGRRQKQQQERRGRRQGGRSGLGGVEADGEAE